MNGQVSEGKGNESELFVQKDLALVGRQAFVPLLECSSFTLN